jgi:putative membrane protein
MQTFASAASLLALLAALFAGCASSGKAGADAAAAGATASASADGAAAPGGTASAPGAPAEPAKPDPSMTPAEFLRAVAQADLAQIQLGNVVKRDGLSPQVKDMAHRMVTNHVAIQAIVARAAAKTSTVLPSEPDEQGKAAVARIGALKGDDLDKAYMMWLAEESQRILALYRWQYDNCQNEAVKPFAQQTAPIIGTHARVADALNQDVNKEALRLAAERKAAEEKAAEEARVAAAMAEAQKNTKKQPPQRKSMLRKSPVAKPAPEPEPAAEG